MASYDQIVKSKEFQEADHPTRIRMVSEFFDMSREAVSEEERPRVDMFKKVAIGGLDAENRSKGTLYPELAAKEAQQYRNAWFTMSRDDSTDEEVQSALSGIDAAHRETTGRMQADASELNNLSKTRYDNAQNLVKALSTSQGPGELIQTFAEARDNTIRRDESGAWETPSFPIVAPEAKAEAPEPEKTGTDKIADVLMNLPGTPSSMFKQLKAIPGAIEGGLETATRALSSAATRFGVRSTGRSQSIETLQQQTGMSDEDVQRAWSDASAINKPWGEEPFRILSSGQIIANQKGGALLDTEAVTKAVNESAAPPLVKADFLKGLQAHQDVAADAMGENLVAASQVHNLSMEDFGDAFKQGVSEGKNKRQIVDEFLKRNQSTGLGGMLKEAVVGSLFETGSMKMSQTLAGAAASVTGFNALQDAAANISSTMNKAAAANPALSNDIGWIDSALSEAPSIGMMVLATKGIGYGAGGVARLAGATEATAGRMAGNVAMAAGPAFSGVQSAGLTYADEFLAATEKGIGRDKAHEMAQGKAYKAGAATGIITGMFSYAGLGGVEAAAARGVGANATMGEFRAALAKAGVPEREAAKNFFGKIISSPIAKGFLGEGAEEGLDTLTSSFLLADPGAPVFRAFENAFDSFGIGGLTGAATGVREAQLEGRVEKKKKATEAERQKSLAAERAKKPEKIFGEVVETPDVIDPATGLVLDAKAQAGLAAAAGPEDQRKPGDVTEEWETADGKIAGLRFDPTGVTPVTKNSDGTWVETGDSKVPLAKARRQLIDKGYAPARGMTASGETVDFTDEEKDFQVRLTREDTQEKLQRFDRMRTAAEDAMLLRLSEEDRSNQSVLADRAKREKAADRQARATMTPEDRAAATAEIEQAALPGNLGPKGPTVTGPTVTGPTVTGPTVTGPTVGQEEETPTTQTDASENQVEETGGLPAVEGQPANTEAEGEAQEGAPQQESQNQEVTNEPAAPTETGIPQAEAEGGTQQDEGAPGVGEGVATPEPAGEPAAPVVPVDQARETFIDDTEEHKTNLSNAATLKKRADNALKKGYITKADHAETVRLIADAKADAKADNKGKPREDHVDPDLGDAWDSVIGSMRAKVETDSAPVVAPAVTPVAAPVPTAEPAAEPEAPARTTQELLDERKESVGFLIDESLESGDIKHAKHGELHDKLHRATTQAQVTAVMKQLNDSTNRDDVLGYDEEEFDPETGTYSTPVQDRIPSHTPISITAKTVQTLVRDLARRTNLKISWVDNLPDNVNGEYVPSTGEVRLNVNTIRQTAETPLHEVSHAIISALRATNRDLYLKLAIEMNKMIDTDPALRRIRDKVIDHYGSRVQESLILDEMMARYLGINGAAAFGKQVDSAKPGAKAWAKQAWASITTMFRRLFKDRLTVKDLSAVTTLDDIVGMMTSPDAFFNFKKGGESADQDLRTVVYDYGSGMVITSRALLESISEGGASVAWVPTSEGPRLRVITGSDGKQDVQQIVDMGDNLKRDTTNAQWNSLNEKLGDHLSETLDEDFWKGHEDLRQKISPYVEDPSATQLETIIHFVVRTNDSWKLAMKEANGGHVPISGNEGINLNEALLSLQLLNVGSPAIRTTITQIPKRANSSMLNMLGGEVGWLAELADSNPGKATVLNPDQIQQLRAALQQRLDLGNVIRGSMEGAAVTSSQATDAIKKALDDEQAAAKTAMDFYKKNPFDKKGVSAEDFTNGNYPGELSGWVAQRAKVAASKAATALASGKFSETTRQMAAPKPSAPARVGDGTPEGLHTAISDKPEFHTPLGKIIPTADGSPQKGFADEERARAFRTRITAREGLPSPMSLKVITQMEGGVVTYLVVIPHPFGSAATKAVIDANEVVSSDPFTLLQLPTFKQNADFLEKNGGNFARLMLRARRGINSKIPEGWWFHSKDVEQESLGEKLDPLIQNTELQMTRADSIGNNVEVQLRARFGNSFGVDMEFGSPTYGHALEIAIPPGKSPYMEDILQELMVDPYAYALTPDQREYVDTIRSVLEQMRDLMRQGHLDRKFLNEMGLDMQNFLEEPGAAKGTAREWFPRFVLGYMEDGEFQEKEYTGMGSPKTEHKGYEQARMTGADGRWLSRDQIANGTPDQQALVYSADPAANVGMFLRTAYTALAASQLRQNLDEAGHILVEGSVGKSSLKTMHPQGIPVLNDALFDNKTGMYLEQKLVKDKQISSTLEKAMIGAMISKSIVLGGADIAAPATVAAIATFTQPFRTIISSTPHEGVVDLLKNSMQGVVGLAKDAQTDGSAFHKMCVEVSPYVTEMVSLGGKYGGGLDYNQTLRSMARAAEINNAKADDSKAQLGTLAVKAGLSKYGKRLSDFHTNFVTIAKAQMWKAIRTRFLDESGQLATDPASIEAMKAEVLSIDRSFGHSVDMDISLMSRTMKGVLGMVMTAPGLYLSLSKNLTTKEGIRHAGEYAAASVFYFVAAAFSAGMPEDEIFRRLDPRKPGFMTVDIDMGTGGNIKVGLGHFYKSLVVATAKTYDNADRIMNGEVLTPGEIITPIMNLGRSRLSPFMSAIIGLYTGEDYMGNRVTKGSTILGAFTPASVHEPLSTTMDRVIGTTYWATAEQNFNSTERETLSHPTAGFIFNALGLNSYTEGANQEMSRRKDEAAREKYGKSFKDISDIKAAAEIAEKVVKEVGVVPKFSNPEGIAEWKQREAERFIQTMDSRTQRIVKASGADGLLKVSSGIKTTSGAYVSLTGLNRDENNKNAIQIAIGEGLGKVMDQIDKDGIHPVEKQKEIAKFLNDAVNASNKKLQAKSGMKPPAPARKAGGRTTTR